MLPSENKDDQDSEVSEQSSSLSNLHLAGVSLSGDSFLDSPSERSNTLSISRLRSALFVAKHELTSFPAQLDQGLRSPSSRNAEVP